MSTWKGRKWTTANGKKRPLARPRATVRYRLKAAVELFELVAPNQHRHQYIDCKQCGDGFNEWSNHQRLHAVVRLWKKADIHQDALPHVKTCRSQKSQNVGISVSHLAEPSELREENAKLKRMYADLVLMYHALKDVDERKPWLRAWRTRCAIPIEEYL